MSDRWDEFDDVVRTLAVLSARLRVQGHEAASGKLLDAAKMVKAVADELDAESTPSRYAGDWDRMLAWGLKRTGATHGTLVHAMKRFGWTTTKAEAIRAILRRFKAEGIDFEVLDEHAELVETG